MTRSAIARLGAGSSSDASSTHCLFSAYPLTGAIVDRLQEALGLASPSILVLGTLKRNSMREIVRAIRNVRCGTLWIVVSDHNYQPYLPLFLLLAALTRAGAIRVVDYSGSAYPVSRLNILAREPLRLGTGCIRGMLALARIAREVTRLRRAHPLPPKPIPSRPAIAYLKTNLWFGVQAGGSVGHVAGVVNGFARLGCDIEVVSAEALPMIDPSVRVSIVRGAGVTGLPLELNSYLFHELFSEQLGQRLSQLRPDLVYQRYCLCNYSGVVASRRLGVPLVLEYNGSEVWVSEHWGTPLRFSRIASIIEDINLRHASIIIVVSEVLRDELLERGIPSDRIVFYPNCIDPSVFDASRFSAEDIRGLRSRYGIGHDEVVCAFLGTFGPWHGADVLARVIRTLAQSRLDWLRKHRVRFMLVGDGQLMPRVKEILREVPAELVTLTGLVQQDQAPLHLAAADILVSPHVPNPDGTRFFGSPTKLFEYMGMSRAIVASELEQIGWVLRGSWHVGKRGMPSRVEDVEESCALLVTPGVEEDLMSAITWLVEHPEARERIGQRARKVVLSQYTWESQVRHIVSRLDCGDGNRGPAKSSSS